VTESDVGILTDRFEKMLETAKVLFKPLIILWGPAKSNEEGFRKREKVAGAIREESQNATVLYPEDAVDATKIFVDDLDMQEAMQAVAADLVIALDISPGVAEEIARYSRDQRIARRLFIIAPESRQDGYGAIIRRALKVKFLRDLDLKTCSVASELCQREVRRWLIGKLLEEDLGFVS
jgi:hypothetical protein